MSDAAFAIGSPEHFRPLVRVLFLVALLSGCSDDGTSNPSADAAADGRGDIAITEAGVEAGPPIACTAPQTGAPSTMVGKVDPFGVGPDLVGRELCMTQLNCKPVSNCVTVDSAKTFTFDNIPEGSFVVLEFGDSDYRKLRLPLVVRQADKDVLGVSPPSKAVAALLLSAAKVNEDPQKGIVVYQTAYAGSGGLTLGIEGVSVQRAPAAGAGPFYLDKSFVPDSSLSATSTASTAVFFNVPPGGYEIVATGEPGGCRTYASDDASGAALRANVEAGKITVVQRLCPAP